MNQTVSTPNTSVADATAATDVAGGSGRTLLDVMADHVEHKHRNSNLFVFDPTIKEYARVSYARMVRQSYAFGEQLLESGAEAQSVCMISCHSPYATLVAFYGAISAGVIPMIFLMPKALGSHEALGERIKHWGSRFALTSTLVIAVSYTHLTLPTKA